MKMKIKNILIVLAVCSAIFACSEDEIKTYDGKDFIYFGNRVDSTVGVVHWDTLASFNFFFEPTVDEKIIEVKVTRGGISDEDKEFLIDVEVLSGTEGSDFEVSRTHVMPAGKSSVYIPVKVYKTAALENKTFEIDLHLRPNENFALALPEIYQSGDTIQRATMRVKFENVLSAPEVWNAAGRQPYIGYFSQAKFNEFTNLFGLTIDDWTNTQSKLFRNWNNYCIAFISHLNDKISQGPDVALKDPDAQSWRGYMYFPGYEWYGVIYAPAAMIPDDFPTTPEWEGNE